MAIAKTVYSNCGLYIGFVTKESIQIYNSTDYSLMVPVFEKSLKFGENFPSGLAVTSILNLREFANQHWPINNVVNLKS